MASFIFAGFYFLRSDRWKKESGTHQTKQSSGMKLKETTKKCVKISRLLWKKYTTQLKICQGKISIQE